MRLSIPKRSVRLAGHNTSITLEPEFWAALDTIATSQKCSVNSLIARIDKSRTGNLSSALRVFILKETQKSKPAV